LLARRFLYIIAGLIVLTLAAGIGWTLFQDQLMRFAFVPGTRFDANAAGPAPDYARPATWLARPDLPDDPSRWVPKGVTRTAKPEVAVFYVAPTTYYGKASWNAALDDSESRRWLTVFGWSEASAFNGVGAVWAPRYRSATLGAFMTKAPDSAKALDLAYGDVLRAFDAFLAQIPASRPIILAGHSQGTVHLMRLMQERVAGKPVAQRWACPAARRRVRRTACCRGRASPSPPIPTRSAKSSTAAPALPASRARAPRCSASIR
jgi:hypothetical protein